MAIYFVMDTNMDTNMNFCSVLVLQTQSSRRSSQSLEAEAEGEQAEESLASPGGSTTKSLEGPSTSTSASRKKKKSEELATVLRDFLQADRSAGQEIERVVSANSLKI